MISVGLDLFGLAARMRAFGPSLPLDSLSAAAAYSTRRLRSGYTGAAIRVRRSSDNTEADIGFTALGDLDTRALLAHAGENALLQSEGLSTAAWGKSAGSSVSPAGTHNGSAAWRFTEGGGDVRHRVNSTVFTRPASTALVARVRVKSEGRQFVQIIFNAPISTLHQNFDLENLTSGGSAGLNPTITDVGDGWRELTLTYPAAASGSGSFFIGGASSLAMARDLPYVGDGTSGFLIAQPQVTFGDAVKPYAPTGAAALVGGDGLVATWYDQSGNARNATQATASSQPRIVNAGVVETDGLARPALSLDGTDFLACSLSPDRTAFPDLTVSAVYRTTDLTTFKALWGADNGGFDRGQLLGSAGNNWGLLAGNTSVSQAAVLSTTAPIVYTATLRVGVPNGSSVAANGVLNTAFTEALGSAHGTLGIGALNGGGAFPMFGFVREMVFLAGALTTAQRQALERNQGAYYGITVA
jgi:hypothetical protein